MVHRVIDNGEANVLQLRGADSEVCVQAMSDGGELFLQWLLDSSSDD